MLETRWPATLALLLPLWLLQRHEREWHRLGLLTRLQELCQGRRDAQGGAEPLVLSVLAAWQEGRPEALEPFLATGEMEAQGLSPALQEDLHRALDWRGQDAHHLCHALMMEGARHHPPLFALCRLWVALDQGKAREVHGPLQELLALNDGPLRRLAQTLERELPRILPPGSAPGVAEARCSGAQPNGATVQGETQRQREICRLACHRYGRMVGSAPAFLGMERRLRQAAQDRLPVLLTGETGTGKELAVEYLHRLAFPAGRPLVAVNCGGLSESLAEAELFGSTRGAFTGAVEREGLVAQAESGTLFLDEFAALPPSVQARLLRFLESGVYRRVGEARERQVQVRVVAATCEVRRLREGLRQDLLHRVAGRVLEMPSLDARREDIPLLVKAFLLDHGVWDPGAHPLSSPMAQQHLQQAAWPGNIRQLRHTVLRLADMRGAELEQELLALEGAPVHAQSAARESPLLEGGSLKEALARFERRCIREALDAHGQDRRRAALQLGISMPTLYSRLREAGAVSG